MDEIARRIRNMVVAMPYGLEVMLGLFDIVESDKIPTAAVSLGGRPCLLINPNFVEKPVRAEDQDVRPKPKRKPSPQRPGLLVIPWEFPLPQWGPVIVGEKTWEIKYTLIVI